MTKPGSGRVWRIDIPPLTSLSACHRRKAQMGKPRMKSYRVVMFVDAPAKKIECTEDISLEIQHMIRLYEMDMPIATVSLSSIVPIGPDGKPIS
jgi:hypothetical protein